MTVETDPRAIDLAIAEHVLHWEITHHGVRDVGIYAGFPPGATGIGKMIPRYATDLAAAWQVVDALNREGLVVEVTSYRTDLADMGEISAHARIIRFGSIEHTTWGRTPALAICRAALAYRGIPESKEIAS